MVCAVSAAAIDSDVWTFFPICMGGGVMNMGVGVVSQLVKPEWALAVESSDIEMD